MNGMVKAAVYALLALCFVASCHAQFNIDINDFIGGGAGAGKECAYKCSNGASPVPRDGHVPQSNGCGVPGFMIESHHGLTPCCHKHDICYHSCQTGKDRKKGQEKCDNEFAECMKDLCKGKPGKDQADCNSEANTFSSGVKLLGCNAYQDSQKEACSCPGMSPGDTALAKVKEQQRVELLVAFYKKHDASKGEDHVKKIIKNKTGVQFVEICAALAKKYGQHPRDFLRDELRGDL